MLPCCRHLKDMGLSSGGGGRTGRGQWKFVTENFDFRFRKDDLSTYPSKWHFFMDDLDFTLAWGFQMWHGHPPPPQWKTSHGQLAQFTPPVHVAMPLLHSVCHIFNANSLATSNWDIIITGSLGLKTIAPVIPVSPTDQLTLMMMTKTLTLKILKEYFWLVVKYLGKGSLLVDQCP